MLGGVGLLLLAFLCRGGDGLVLLKEVSGGEYLAISVALKEHGFKTQSEITNYNIGMAVEEGNYQVVFVPLSDVGIRGGGHPVYGLRMSLCG